MPVSNEKQRRVAFLFTTMSIIVLAAAGSALALAASRITPPTVSASEEMPRKLEMPDAVALLAGAIAVAGSTLGAGYALGSVARGGFAAAAERPQLTVWLLIMGGLAEGIAVYGLLVAILILGRI